MSESSQSSNVSETESTEAQAQAQTKPKVKRSHLIFIDELPSTAQQITEYVTRKSTHRFDSLYFDPVSGKFYIRTTRVRELSNKSPNFVIARNTDKKSVRISFRTFQNAWNDAHPDAQISIYHRKSRGPRSNADTATEIVRAGNEEA